MCSAVDDLVRERRVGCFFVRLRAAEQRRPLGGVCWPVVHSLGRLDAVAVCVYDYLPAVVVHSVMASTTREDHVVDVGGAALGHGFDVVSFTDCVGRAASHACAVARDERSIRLSSAKRFLLPCHNGLPLSLNSTPKASELHNSSSSTLAGNGSPPASSPTRLLCAASRWAITAT